MANYVQAKFRNDGNAENDTQYTENWQMWIDSKKSKRFTKIISKPSKRFWLKS